MVRLDEAPLVPLVLAPGAVELASDARLEDIFQVRQSCVHIAV